MGLNAMPDKSCKTCTDTGNPEQLGFESPKGLKVNNRG